MRVNIGKECNLNTSNVLVSRRDKDYFNHGSRVYTQEEITELANEIATTEDLNIKSILNAQNNKILLSVESFKERDIDTLYSTVSNIISRFNSTNNIAGKTFNLYTWNQNDNILEIDFK